MESSKKIGAGQVDVQGGGGNMLRSYKQQLPDYLIPGDTNVYKIKESDVDLIDLPTGGKGIKLSYMTDSENRADIPFIFGNSYSALVHTHRQLSNNRMDNTVVHSSIKSNEDYVPSLATFNVGSGFSQGANTWVNSIIDDDDKLWCINEGLYSYQGVSGYLHIIDTNGDLLFTAGDANYQLNKIKRIGNKLFLTGYVSAGSGFNGVILVYDLTAVGYTPILIKEYVGYSVGNVIEYSTGGYLVLSSNSSPKLFRTDSDLNITHEFTPTFGNQATSIIEDNNGFIWASCGTEPTINIFDSTINNATPVVVDVSVEMVSPVSSYGVELYKQPNGKIISYPSLSGNGVAFDYAILRWNANGSIDSVFKTTIGIGTHTTPLLQFIPLSSGAFLASNRSGGGTGKYDIDGNLILNIPHNIYLFAVVDEANNLIYDHQYNGFTTKLSLMSGAVLSQTSLPKSTTEGWGVTMTYNSVGKLHIVGLGMGGYDTINTHYILRLNADLTNDTISDTSAFAEQYYTEFESIGIAPEIEVPHLVTDGDFLYLKVSDTEIENVAYTIDLIEAVGGKGTIDNYYS